MEWQPIETAPISKEVLIYSNDGIEICIQSAGLLGRKRKWINIFETELYPTYWMPLPPPPKGE